MTIPRAVIKTIQNGGEHPFYGIQSLIDLLLVRSWLIHGSHGVSNGLGRKD